MAAHTFTPAAEAAGLMAFIDSAPTPFHACDQAAARLEEAGYARVAEAGPFPDEAGRHYLIRGGSLLAWDHADADPIGRGFRVVAAHTDSPNVRLKPHADHVRSGWQALAVEPYGGLLRNSWLDRDLGLAGRVVVRVDGAVTTRLFHDPRPLLRVPQLAIHLDRTQNDALTLNPQDHLTPVWGLGTTPGDLTDYLAEQAGAAAGRDVLGWDVMAYPVEPAALLGLRQEFIAAPRMDNLATSYAGLRALVGAGNRGGGPVRVLVLFDHEEVGSQSERGAQSPLLSTTLERIVLARNGSRDDYHRSLASTIVASGDMAHATHPNYPDRHDPLHRIAINGGPVLKVNTTMRYATDALGEAAFRLACEQAGVPVQTFVSRNDLPCGSTVGPMTAALLGVTTVDFGAPLLSMHSARELGGAHDPAMYAAALAAFLTPPDA